MIPLQIKLQVGKSHVIENTKCSNALVAVEELIWNALDADAKNVSVTLNHNKLEAIDTIRIEDDGDGISFEAWRDAFGRLGDSLKVNQRQSKSGRSVHGKSGKGRLKALGVGSLVKWISRYKDDSGRVNQFTITGSRANIRQFVATEPVELDDSARTGVTVEITNLDNGLAKLENLEIAAVELSQKFCLYLSQYPGILIKLSGVPLDPETNKAHQATYPLTVKVEEGRWVDANLTIVEWKQASERAVYLCDSSGFARDEQKTKIKKSTGWKFSAYLQSTYIDELDHQASLGLPELHKGLQAIIEAGHDAVASHFLDRELERARGLVDSWKAEKIYPYASKPNTPLEGIEQKVFDVCAMNVNSYIRDFNSSSQANKKLTFRLLREALAQNPTKLGKILREIVALPQARQEELSGLLDRAKLSAVISASNQVINRLRFLDSLDDMIFGSLSKTLNEPRQLHRVLAHELWVFGDQYALGADEKGLKNVLKAHIEILGRDEPVTEDVSLIDGSDARFDLMLWTQVPTMQNHVEHLVIELKRPSVKIGAEEITQIQKYGISVANDTRFDKAQTNWKFVLVGKELDDYAEAMCKSNDRAFGHLKSGNPSIHLTTWSAIIRDARWRYSFFKSELDAELTDDDGLHYLREKHSEYFAEDWSVPKKPKSP